MDGKSFALYFKRDKSQELFPSKNKTIANSGLGHGDMIYLFPSNLIQNQTALPSQASSENGMGAITPFVANSTSSLLSSLVGSKIPNRSIVEEDNVDLVLQKMDGLIKRKRDTKRYERNI